MEPLSISTNDLSVNKISVFSSDKISSIEDQECEISKWLKLENDPILPPIAGSDSLSLYSTGNAAANSCPTTSLSVACNQYDYITPSTSVQNLPRCNTNTIQQQVPMRTPANQPAQFMAASNSTFNTQSYPNVASSAYSYSSYSAQPYDRSNFNAPQQSTSQDQVQKNFMMYGQPMPQNSNCFPQEYSMPNPGAPFNITPYQYSQFAQTAFATGVPDLQQFATPQLFQLFAQFQQIVKQTEEITAEEKKKKSSRPSARKPRQTRPKVVESKGAVQCKGKNRKKSMQCRNAALMEYIGPRPQYCAEHIELDPRSLYVKCASTYQKEVGDNKGCKEVVLKEFGICYKHYSDLVAEFVKVHDIDTIRRHKERISELLHTLEKEASAAKKKDGDLYQRKNKLIPKFQDMRKTISRAYETVAQTLKVEEDITDRSPMSPEDFLSGEDLPSKVFDMNENDWSGEDSFPSDD